MGKLTLAAGGIFCHLLLRILFALCFFEWPNHSITILQIPTRESLTFGVGICGGTLPPAFRSHVRQCRPDDVNVGAILHGRKTEE